MMTLSIDDIAFRIMENEHDPKTMEEMRKCLSEECEVSPGEISDQLCMDVDIRCGEISKEWYPHLGYKLLEDRPDGKQTRWGVMESLLNKLESVSRSERYHQIASLREAIREVFLSKDEYLVYEFSVPKGYNLWVKKLGQTHLSRSGSGDTVCGMPMLGNHYEHHLRKVKCEACWSKV